MPSISRPAALSSFTSLWKIARGENWLKHLAVPVAATMLLALCAHISLPLALTPVPVTMQTFAVLLLGILLGPGAAVSTMLLYLAEGAVGMPVFSPQGPGGLSQLSGLSAGYLLSYPLVAFASGYLFRLMQRSPSTFVASLLAATVSDLLLLCCGSLWLIFLLQISPLHALRIGMFPFLAGEVCKVLAVAAVVPVLQRGNQAS